MNADVTRPSSRGRRSRLLFRAYYTREGTSLTLRFASPLPPPSAEDIVTHDIRHERTQVSPLLLQSRTPELVRSARFARRDATRCSTTDVTAGVRRPLRFVSLRKRRGRGLFSSEGRTLCDNTRNPEDNCRGSSRARSRSVRNAFTRCGARALSPRRTPKIPEQILTNTRTRRRATPSANGLACHGMSSAIARPFPQLSIQDSPR